VSVVDDKLPHGWVRAKLGELGMDCTRNIDPSKYPNKEFELWSVPSFPSGEPEIQLGEDIASSKQEVVEGDVLLCKINPRINRVWVVGARREFQQIASSEWIVFRNGEVDPDFLMHRLREGVFRGRLCADVSGVGGSLTRARPQTVKNLEVTLPPLPEQRRIVAKIEALQERCRKAREALAEVGPLLEQFRQSLLAAAFRGDLTADWRAANPNVEPASELLNRIRQERRQKWEQSELAKYEAKGKKPPQDWREEYTELKSIDDTDLPKLPNGWCWVRWELVGDCQNGRAFPSKHYSQAGTKLLRPGNLHVSGRIDWTEKNTQYMPKEWEHDHTSYVVGSRELVMNLTAQSLKDEFLGRVCLTDEGEHCLLNQRIARISPHQSISPEFCLLLFKSPQFRRYVDTLNSGSLIQHMFTTQVAKFVFPLPPVEEHAEIVAATQAALEARDLISRVVDESHSDLKQLDQSVLAKAFRGELVPQDPSDEPASVLLARIRAKCKATQASNPAMTRVRTVGAKL
jgi:type I restriction enzyme S subunit